MLLTSVLFLSCSKSEPRRPINKVKSSGVNVSIELNKRIRVLEEKWIEDYIKKDSLTTYQHSPFGFAYTVTKTSNKPKKESNKNTVYTFERTVYTLGNQLIYPKQLIKSRVAVSDEITGIKEGIKLMREDEEFKFIFTSFVAHGFYGDGNRIGANTPIIVKIKLLNINN